MLRRLFNCSALAVFVAMAFVAPARAVDPPRGSPVRKAVLDVLRVRVVRDIGPPVEFRISRMNVENGWAFVSATPQRRGGMPIDWSKTKYARAFSADAMSDVVLALLRRNGPGWKIVEYVLGPTDVTWVEWIKIYGLPRTFFLPGG